VGEATQFDRSVTVSTAIQSETLAARIDAEFVAAEQKLKQLQQQQVEQYEQRQHRLAKLEQTLDKHRDVWRPRLETLANRFADRVKITPAIVPAQRSARLEFQSELAQVRLRFSVSPDEEVRQVVFKYDLEILPVLMKFEAHNEIQFPLDRVDADALGKWIDERIMTFVRTYLSMYENTYYLKDHLVQDPVAKVRFPKYAAAAQLERDGQTVYFISEATRRQYEQQNAQDK
jgi:YHS domain-containing protein